MLKRINKKFLTFIITLIALISLNASVFAFGCNLNNIKIEDQNGSTRLIFQLSKLPKEIEFNNKNPKEVEIVFKETYLSSALIKNLDIILNDNIKWKQYNDKLSINFKHKGISDLSKLLKSKKEKLIVIDIPNSRVITDKTLEKAAQNIKPAPAPKRVNRISRSISSLREDLPQYVKTNKSNPNNKIYFKQIHPGVTHMKILRTTAVGPLFINVIDVSPGNPTIEVAPTLANEKIFGKKTIRTIIKESNALAGINAGFFKPPTGVPLGTLIIGDELVSGPIYDRVTLGITRDERYRIERIHLAGQLITKDGNLININNVNQPRLSYKDTLLYSYRWGSKTPTAPKGTKQIVLVNNKVTNTGLEESMIVPNNGYVIAGPDQGTFSNLKVGDNLKLIVTTTPDWSNVKHAIGGGPFLVKNSQVYIDRDAQKFSLANVRAPRTAVGVTRDDHLLLVTIDGRQKDVSIGVTFEELAAIMIELGSINAMNLDGGSSTQMCVLDEIVNSPTIAGGSTVSNGLIVKTK